MTTDLAIDFDTATRSLALVEKRVHDFANVAGINYVQAAEFLTFSQQLNFFRWLEGECQRMIDCWHEMPGASYSELIRQKRIASKMRQRLELVQGDLQQVVARPLPDFAQAKMMTWAMEETA